MADLWLLAIGRGGGEGSGGESNTARTNFGRAGGVGYGGGGGGRLRFLNRPQIEGGAGNIDGGVGADYNAETDGQGEIVDYRPADQIEG